MKIIKEACIDNILSIDHAIKSNEVDRFETCSNLEEGGLTPTIEIFEYIKTYAKDIDQVIMIRNKNSFYIENSEDIEEMKKSIEEFCQRGGKHFIFGYIDKQGKIDTKSCLELIETIKKYENTTWNFHMAIDLVNDYDEAFETLIKHKFTRVLTKGGKSSAIQNIDNLKRLNKKYGNKIEILVGGKVTKDNYLEIHKKTNLTQFHGTQIV